MECFFGFAAHGTALRTEILAGITTWLTMAYIVVVNPSILAAAGIDHGAAFVATCLAAAIGSAAMGLLANLPLALAPGMGMNAFFSFVVVKGIGLSWRVALAGVLGLGMVSVVLTFLLVDVLDNAGTLIATTRRAGLIRPDGSVPRLREALLADSGAAMLGAMLGTSTVTSYIESAAGIQAGRRTGMTALVVALGMPFTFSIATGVALGVIAHVAVKLIAGRAREISRPVWAITALSALKFALAPVG